MDEAEARERLKQGMPDLVWMTNEDHGKLLKVVNIATLLLFYSNDEEVPFTVYDLDGEAADAEMFAIWRKAVDEGHDALSRAKYVPEGLNKLKLMLLSD